MRLPCAFHAPSLQAKVIVDCLTFVQVKAIKEPQPYRGFKLEQEQHDAPQTQP